MTTSQSIEIGKQYVFDYPDAFTTLPEYTAHAGQMVTVIDVVDVGDPENMEAVYKVQANDGWIGEAFESELIQQKES